MEKVFETPKKERFEFVFSINGYIICQRYFKINNFQERALGSVQLAEAVNECMRIIDNDLKEKSHIYLSLTAPQVFKNSKEMNEWVEKQNFKLDVPSYVILSESDDVFVWNGETMVKYDKPFNRSDYVGTDNVQSVLKFAFLDNGEEVRSISWDGSRYPRFVRNNIDISNSRNKYKTDDNFQPFEATIIDAFNEDRSDLIPQLMRVISYACNSETRKYFYRRRFGDNDYDYNLKGYNERLFISLKKR